MRSKNLETEFGLKTDSELQQKYKNTLNIERNSHTVSKSAARLDREGSTVRILLSPLAQEGSRIPGISNKL